MSDSEILYLSPRQTQIKLFEIREFELEDSVRDFIRNGGKPERLDGDLLRKYQEMQGLVVEVIDFDDDQRGLTKMDKKYLEKLKHDPNTKIEDVLK